MVNTAAYERSVAEGHIVYLKLSLAGKIKNKNLGGSIAHKPKIVTAKRGRWNASPKKKRSYENWSVAPGGHERAMKMPTHKPISSQEWIPR